MNYQMQVKKQHYSKDYDSLERFISYHSQIELIRKVNPKTILEVGIGNKTVSNYLKNNGFNVTTCDFDSSLRPDKVGDIRNLPFKDNSYDLVMACEILEHLPWNELDTALKELQRVSRKYVLISLPYPGIVFEAAIKLPLVKKLIRKKQINLFFRIPLFFKKLKFNGEHYWEVGVKGYPISRIKRILKRRFRILKETRSVLNSYHYFFLLEKDINK